MIKIESVKITLSLKCVLTEDCGQTVLKHKYFTAWLDHTMK